MRITRADLEAVKYSCLYFHYAKTVPVYLYAYNIYNDNNEWCGCILFGLGANKNINTMLNCISGTLLELQRVALNGKQGHNATSKAVGMAMREVKKDAVCLKCLFSYADTEQKHVGIIYQATNWIYLGERVMNEGSYYEKDGKIFHARSVNSKYKGRNKKELGFKNYQGPNKHLYVFPYDKKLRNIFLEKRKQYPKREINNA